MPVETLCLNGSDWKVLQMMPREWEWKNVGVAADTVSPSLWVPAIVPGTAQDDARDAGMCPDFAVDFNSRACEWVGERDWVYLKRFETPALAADSVVRLCFEGVDHACDVYLNGAYLGRHEGMYRPFEYEVTALLKSGEPNTLVVVVEHAPREIGQIGRTSEVKLWKARFAYSWDWCTRLIPIGIYDDVALKVTGQAYLRDVHVTTQLADDFASATVGVDLDIATLTTGPVTAQVAVTLDGQPVASATCQALASGISTGAAVVLDLPEPKLWWPNNYGDQPLYLATVTLLDASGQVTDTREVIFGVRRVRAVANDGAPEGALPYVLEVNGRRVFIKGWNWAPINQLYGRQMLDRYERWVGMAAHAHCNFLRVWGGGLLEKKAFYNLCDRLGIMVWQEFIQSSSGIDNRPSTAPEYLAHIREQAEAMIPRRRNHASLVLWCGGNELMHDDWTPLDDTHPALATLKDCVRRLDPDKLWLPTSASGPTANASADNLGKMHDVHGPWQYQGPEGHYALYNTIDPLLHAEFGVEGAANLASARRSNTLPLWPPDETNALFMHKGAWWVQRPTMTTVFGDIQDLETYVLASQFLQAEGLRYSVEANRRRKWHCAGTSPWQFNESFPNLSCTNVMDYYGQPRPAFWWCRDAYEPLHASASYDKLGWEVGEEFGARIWLNNSLPAQAGCKVAWQIISLEGDCLEAGEALLDAPMDAAVQVAEVRWTVPVLKSGAFILRLRVCAPGICVPPRDYLFGTQGAPVYAPLLKAPRTTLKVEREPGQLTLANTGNAVALFVRIEAADGAAWVQPGRNFILLAPGEQATIALDTDDVPLSITGWNFDTLEV